MFDFFAFQGSDDKLSISPPKKKLAVENLIETPRNETSTMPINEDSTAKIDSQFEGISDGVEALEMEELLEKEDENYENLNERYRSSLIQKSAMEKSKSELEQEIAEKNLKIDQLVKELDSSFNELKSDTFIDALKREISEKELEVETMQERYKESQTQLIILVERCDQLAKQIDENKSTITNLQTMNDSLRKSNSALVYEIVANSSRISECNDTIHEVEHELAEKSEDISNLKSELRISYADLKDLCNELTSSQEKIRLLEKNLDEKSSKVEELSVDLKVKSKQVSSLQTDLGILEHELVEIKKNADCLMNTKSAMPKYTFGYIAATALVACYSLMRAFSS